MNTTTITATKTEKVETKFKFDVGDEIRHRSEPASGYSRAVIGHEINELGDPKYRLKYPNGHVGQLGRSYVDREFVLVGKPHGYTLVTEKEVPTSKVVEHRYAVGDIITWGTRNTAWKIEGVSENQHGVLVYDMILDHGLREGNWKVGRKSEIRVGQIDTDMTVEVLNRPLFKVGDTIRWNTDFSLAYEIVEISDGKYRLKYPNGHVGQLGRSYVDREWVLVGKPHGYTLVTEKEVPTSNVVEHRYAVGDIITWGARRTAWKIEGVNENQHGVPVYNMTLDHGLSEGNWSVGGKHQTLVRQIDTDMTVEVLNRPLFKVGDTIRWNTGTSLEYEIVDIADGKYKISYQGGKYSYNISDVDSPTERPNWERLVETWEAPTA